MNKSEIANIVKYIFTLPPMQAWPRIISGISYTFRKWRSPQSFIQQSVKHLMLSVLVTSRCNIKCQFCVYENNKNRYQDVTVHEFKKFIYQRAVQNAVVLDYNGGEPLLHPQIGELLTEGRKAGFYTYLCTNGLLLNNALDVFSLGCPHVVRVSLYKKYLDKQMNNLSRLLASRPKSLRVGVSVLLRRSFLEDAFDMVRIALQESVDFVYLQNTFPRNSEEIVEVLQDDDFEVHSFLRRVRRLPGAKTKINNPVLISSVSTTSQHFCNMLAGSCVVDMDGTVFPCCWLMNKSSGLCHQLGDALSAKELDFRKGVFGDGELNKSCKYCFHLSRRGLE